MLADVNGHYKMMSVNDSHGIRQCNIALTFERRYKYMSNSPTIAGFLQYNGGKLEVAGDLKHCQMCFGRSLCVQIEIGQF